MDCVVNVVFSGSVSAQTTTGETVTLKVTKPDLTMDTWTTPTLADKTFTLTKPYPAGNYSIVVSIPADTEYKAAISSSTPFTVNLLDRTITVTVTV
jgi:hypothetical protein